MFVNLRPMAHAPAIAVASWHCDRKEKHNSRESPTSKYGAGETLKIEQVDML